MHFQRRDQAELLDTALGLTGSTGWRNDAVAWGVMDTPKGDLIGIGVFQNFDANGADFHFGLFPGRRLTAGIVGGMIMLATHPRGMNLPRLFAHIAASNRAAQAAALKCGAQFEYRIRGSLRGGEDAIVMALDRGETIRRSAEVETEPAADGGS